MKAIILFLRNDFTGTWYAIYVIVSLIVILLLLRYIVRILNKDNLSYGSGEFSDKNDASSLIVRNDSITEIKDQTLIIK